ncbi:DUF1634 domain-containing protein [Bacteriovorax stolpii]|uniref:DUF1634 domain-containing protein n=1 Tax=Bacteriovorax stolpii TaxID=960 RepID=A0A2K9NVL5_BACTC|nr:DUF1634 domain-containing protein [Bacteriovorax stolpii]AUN99546.1 DUF1634 domain-containing protein [Bacteriovorax stolpii]QDK40459.1 DUF1634 domain-containing protein [Bacteriovorax stolpii]TDP51175.1 putative membrane protein [Bacteriovorax stolpii]
MEQMDQLESLELKISKFLRLGVLVAGLFMLVGWISQSVTQPDSLLALKTYHSSTLSETLSNAWTTNSWGVLISYLGLAILISLPITRVFLTAVLFLKQKEYLLAGIAAFVLVALIVSFSLGIEL